MALTVSMHVLKFSRYWFTSAYLPTARRPPSEAFEAFE
jgi:hypothetical protein